MGDKMFRLVRAAAVSLLMVTGLVAGAVSPASASGVLPPFAPSAASAPSAHADVIWGKTASVPVAYSAKRLDPSNCQGGFGIWENTYSPWGDYRCFASTVARNTCLVSSGPAREFTMNYTSFWWMVFRASDTTCSGAHVNIPHKLLAGPSSGAVWGYDATWANFGPVMRTSATYP